ncbi:class I SAM-dependent methyltransferase [Roseomonas sp. BN140053]|uniref:class I SAM-dependent methyltransferase n=1 Tax=Roseomonas sp. BN140053 TaxID=3391898 RepID=UPI0039E99F53
MIPWDPEEAAALEGPDGLIEVSRLIAAFDPERHAELADQYYRDAPLWSMIFRKPFGDPPMARDMLRKLWAVLDLLGLQAGQSVLDYGCGTGWLCRILLQQKLQVIGVDVSHTALDKAEAWTRENMPPLAGAVRYLPLDGDRIPLADAAVHRVVCFDVFHHLHDQATTLREMARVLRPFGRAVFMEPGPEHSRSPDSQSEMRRFGVIENDVALEQVWHLAQEAGFERCEVALLPDRPFVLPMTQFLDEAARFGTEEPLSPELGELARRQLRPWARHLRCFVLHRAGGTPDSRNMPPPGQRDGREAGSITVLEARRTAGGVFVRLSVRNTGPWHWIPGGSGEGSVNLGVMRRRADGTLERDFQRQRLGPEPPAPGRAVELSFTLPPLGAADAGYELDLVSEGITWFETGVAVTPDAG